MLDNNKSGAIHVHTRNSVTCS